MQTRIGSVLSVVSLCFMVGACSATRVRESWTNPGFADDRMGRTLVIAVVDDELRRSQFEVELADALGRLGVAVMPRANVRALRGKPGRERVVEFVEESDFDHVLVTRLAAIAEEEVEHAGYTEYELQGVRRRFGRFWITGGSVVEHPSYAEERTRLFVETSLFETGEGNVVWRMRTETPNPEYHDLAGELTKAITNRLRGDGLVD